MTETTAVPLEIPDEAVEVMVEHLLPEYLCDFDRAAFLRRVATPILAAELRRLADEIAEDAALIKKGMPPDPAVWSVLDRADMGRVIQGEDDARALRRRADELSPPS